MLRAQAVAFPFCSGTTLPGWWVLAAHGGARPVVLMHDVRGNRRRIAFGKLEGLDAAAALANHLRVNLDRVAGPLTMPALTRVPGKSMLNYMMSPNTGMSSWPC